MGCGMLLDYANIANLRASPLPLLSLLIASNDNCDKNDLKGCLEMSLNFRPLSENIPSWKRDAYSSTNPHFSTITYNVCDHEWELRNKFGELVEAHRDKDELLVELKIWNEVWDAAHPNIKRNSERNKNRKGAA